MTEIELKSCPVFLKPDSTFFSIYNKVNYQQDILTLIYIVKKIDVSCK